MKQHPVYTLVYMVVFCVLSALLLTVPKIEWSDRIEANRLYARKLAMVQASGLHEKGMSRDQVEAIFQNQIIEEDLGYLTIYVAKDASGKEVAYLCDGEGMGHEGPFQYIASFEPDVAAETEVRELNKRMNIGGIVRRSRMMKDMIVYELSETPGLGGRIADPEWAKQFKQLVFEVQSANSDDPKDKDALIDFVAVKEDVNDVVAVTGASNTMRSLNQTLNKLVVAMNKGLMLEPLDLGLTPDQVTRATPGYPKGFVPPPNLRSLDKRPDFMVPEGLVNLAKGCPVELIAGNPDGISGNLSRLTDWNKKSNEDDYVEFLPNDMLQTVQIDLGAEREIFCIVVWHYYKNAIVYRDVIVQTADDREMTKNAAIVFNNDYDNSAGMGVGKNQPYFAGWWGEIIDARPKGRLVQGRRGRYVRVSTCGGEAGEDTRFVEIAVYGREKYEVSDIEEPVYEQPAESSDAVAEETAAEPVELTEEQQMEALRNDPKYSGMVLVEPVTLMQGADIVPLETPEGFEPPKAYSEKPIRQFAMMPKEAVNLSKGCKVTGQPGEDGEPLEGLLEQLTDGIVGGDGSVVEMFPGVMQYVQIDLGAVKDIYGVAVWHGCKSFTVYKDVAVVVADDAEMTVNRRIIYNNDADNSLELGAGTDASYPATGHGKLFVANKTNSVEPIKGRYVRVYTNGSEGGGEDTRLIEVAVFGK